MRGVDFDVQRGESKKSLEVLRGFEWDFEIFWTCLPRGPGMLATVTAQQVSEALPFLYIFVRYLETNWILQCLCNLLYDIWLSWSPTSADWLCSWFIYDFIYLIPWVAVIMLVYVGMILSYMRHVHVPTIYYALDSFPKPLGLQFQIKSSRTSFDSSSNTRTCAIQY